MVTKGRARCVSPLQKKEENQVQPATSCSMPDDGQQLDTGIAITGYMFQRFLLLVILKQLIRFVVKLIYLILVSKWFQKVNYLKP